MARIRTIKPEFFRSRSLARCSVGARLTFAGMWTEADDFGRGIADARIIKGAIWPLDDDVTAEIVAGWLKELAVEHIVLYEVAGEQYYEVSLWEKHQAAAYRTGKSVHPAPLNVEKRERKCKPHDEPCKIVLEGNREGKGREGSTPTRGRASIAPESFDFSPEHVGQWEVTTEANKLGIDLARETQRFLDHHRAKGSKFVDWDAAWRTWIGNAIKFTKPTTTHHESTAARLARLA